MDKEAIQSAAKKLQLLDVVLHDCVLHQASRDTFIPFAQQKLDFFQQNRIAFEADEISVELEDGENARTVLRVFVSLGIRAISGSKDDKLDPDAEQERLLYGIEATFRAEYLMSESLTDDEVREWSEHNAVHNVWPFWRMHVFNTLKLANLPVLNVPLQRLIPPK